MLDVGWVLRREQLSELYQFLQYAEAHCKHEWLIAMTGGRDPERWAAEITKINKWLADVKSKAEG
jgi:hypothetical protein